jgi:hypothetical protein
MSLHHATRLTTGQANSQAEEAYNEGSFGAFAAWVSPPGRDFL